MTAPKPTRARRTARPAPETDPSGVTETVTPAPIGDNMPPEPTPLEIMTTEVEDLYAEAVMWLDGDPVSTEGQADSLTALKGRLQEAVKTVEAERKKIADPLYAEWKAINAAWKPLTEKAEKAVKVAQRALLPWLEAVQAEQRRKAAEAQAEADAAAQRLRDQIAAEKKSSAIADVDRREELEAEAKEAQKIAARAEKETAVIRGDSGKAYLRTVWRCAVEDRKALLLHYLAIDPEWIEGLLAERAAKDTRGGARMIPGCRIYSEQEAI